MTNKKPGGAKAPTAHSPFTSTRAGFADTGFMSAALRKQLWDLLPLKLTPAERKTFLDAVAEELSAPQIDVFPVSHTIEAVQQLASEAQRLQRALRALKPHVFRADPVFAELVLMKKHAGRLPLQLHGIADLADLLQMSMQVTIGLQVFSEHYLDRVKPSRQTKPEIPAAKSLVTRIVWRHCAIFGAVPRGAWFYAFAKTMGADPKVNLPCGRDLVAGAVRNVKPQP
jgi:hypothetical protein